MGRESLHHRVKKKGNFGPAYARSKKATSFKSGLKRKQKKSGGKEKTAQLSYKLLSCVRKGKKKRQRGHDGQKLGERAGKGLAVTGGSEKRKKEQKMTIIPPSTKRQATKKMEGVEHRTQAAVRAPRWKTVERENPNGRLSRRAGPTRTTVGDDRRDKVRQRGGRSWGNHS